MSEMIFVREKQKVKKKNYTKKMEKLKKLRNTETTNQQLLPSPLTSVFPDLKAVLSF